MTCMQQQQKKIFKSNHFYANGIYFCYLYRYFHEIFLNIYDNISLANIKKTGCGNAILSFFLFSQL